MSLVWGERNGMSPLTAEKLLPEPTQCSVAEASEGTGTRSPGRWVTGMRGDQGGLEAWGGWGKAAGVREGARTHFSKSNRGNRMLFLMKIVKFSASIMTGLWARTGGVGFLG